MSLEGVGEKTSCMIANLVKEHYAAFITDIPRVINEEPLKENSPKAKKQGKNSKAQKKSAGSKPKLPSEESKPCQIQAFNSNSDDELNNNLSSSFVQLDPSINENTMFLPEVASLEDSKTISKHFSQIEISKKRMITEDDDGHLFVGEEGFNKEKKRINAFESVLPSSQPIALEEKRKNINRSMGVSNISRLENAIPKVSSKAKYNPEIDSNPWAIMMALYRFFLDKKKKFATRKEIKECANLLNQEV